MQDNSQVGWDPISVRTALPWQSKLFVLYSFIMCVIWFIRSLDLFRQLLIFSNAKQAALHKTDDEDIRVDLLARAAIAGKLSSKTGKQEFDEVQPRGLIEKAEGRFQFLWEMCSIKVASLKKLAILTFLLMMLSLAWREIDFFIEISSAKMLGIGLASGELAEWFSQLTLGIFLCVLLYIANVVFEGMLMRRKAYWNYSHARYKN